MRLLSLFLAAVMLAGVFPAAAFAAQDEDVRYTVLIVDISGSMYGTPEEAQRQAATRFCEQMMAAKGQNYIALVALGSSSSVLADFTSDLELLKSKIAGLGAYEGTNTNDSLVVAGRLMDTVPPEAIKNIVLCSDGLPEHGASTSSGPYSSSQYWGYGYANSAYNTALELKNKGYTIYTLGFFHSVSGSYLEFARQFMQDLASGAGNYHEVIDPSELEFEFGQVAEHITQGSLQDYTFRFSGHLKHYDVESVCHYSDDFFRKDATEFSIPLATMSLCFELTTWSRFDESAEWTTDPNAVNPKFKNARDLLTGADGLGFTDFAVNSFWANRPGRDSIGAVAARKAIDDYTLIALGIRGGGYEQEWASNFTVGKSGDHDGFSTARDNVLSFLKQYISDNQISGKIKLWIVGYSRAGVTANMVAGKLDDGYSLGGVTLNKSDLYAYTFEAPQGTLRSHMNGTYKNIHNILNLNDFVPMVAPKNWGFYRYNTDEWLPAAYTSSAYDTLKPKMLSYYTGFGGSYSISEYVTQYRVRCDWRKFLPGGDPMIWTESYQVGKREALTNATTVVADGIIGSREDYYYDLQSLVREGLAIAYGGSLYDKDAENLTLDVLLSNITNQLTFDRVVEILSPIWAINLDSFETRKEKVQKNLKNFVKEAISDSDLAGAAADLLTLGDTISDILWRFLEFSLSDLFHHQGSSLQSVYNVLKSLGEVGEAHYPELCLAWMNTLYDAYAAEQQEYVNEHGYRVIHINCPVDVLVVEADTGVSVASFVNDQTQATGSSIVSYVDLDGEKIVVLPVTEAYNITISAREDCTVNFAVNEFSLEKDDSTRIINYYDIGAAAGESILAFIPAYSAEEMYADLPDGSTTAYTVTDPAGNNVPVSEELKGEEAVSAQYTVTVTSEDEFAMVMGGGVYPKGNFAEVSASPSPGFAFDGWYVGGEKVSAEETYRFAVLEDTALTAKFTSVETYEVKFMVNGTGGSVENVPLKVNAGSQINVVAVPAEGYVFAGWEAQSGTFADASEASTWFVVDAKDVTVSASFVPGTNPDEEEHHHPENKPGNQPYKPDPNLPITITPIDGYPVGTVEDNRPTNDPVMNIPGQTAAPAIPETPAETPVIPAAEDDFPFVDVDKTDSFYGDVKYVYDNGIMNGISATEFAPNSTLTRAMVVTILYRVEGAPAVEFQGTFTDVEAGQWYSEAVEWAAANGIVNGYGDGRFGPTDAVTLEQLAAILNRYADFKDYAVGEGAAVTGTVSDWAVANVSWAVANDILAAADSYIVPALRSEVATAIHAFCVNVAN